MYVHCNPFLASAKFSTCTVVSVNGTLAENKMRTVHSRVNVHNLASTSVPFPLTTVQVPNFAQTHTKRNTVYAQLQHVQSLIQ
jgi:hypothetical protein